MDFGLDEEYQMIRQMARDFAEKEIAPFAQEIDEKDAFPWPIFNKMAEQGFLGLPFPEEYGGVGMDYIGLSIVLEEIARVSGRMPAMAVMLMMHPAFFSAIILPTACEGISVPR